MISVIIICRCGQLLIDRSIFYLLRRLKFLLNKLKIYHTHTHKKKTSKYALCFFIISSLYIIYVRYSFNVNDLISYF